MAAKTSVAAFTVLCIKFAEGYYCDSDKCSDDEYCCGYNLCCKSYKVWDLWYFWCGLLFFMFLLSMCGCLWRLRARSPVFISGYNYTPLHQESTYVQTCPTAAPILTSHGPHSFQDLRGNPPPYSHPSAMHNKSPSPPPAYSQVVSQRDPYDN